MACSPYDEKRVIFCPSSTASHSGRTRAGDVSIRTTGSDRQSVLQHGESNEPGVACEIDAAGNRLLGAIYKASFEDALKPFWVEKNGELPPSYSLAAMAHAEASLATDDTLNVLYAYVKLFMFKIGVTRATLGVLAERLSFRDFDRRWRLRGEDSRRARRDPHLVQVLGPDKLAEFAEEFAADPDGGHRAPLR